MRAATIEAPAAKLETPVLDQSPTVRLPATIAPCLPTASLASALAAAQQKCQPASKDSKNAYHQYSYASSEAVIIEGKAALAGTGLALVPIEMSLNGGEGRWELHRKFLLLHTSGEQLPIAINWPVCPEKGRPLDKATAIADTSSLAYLLRDLLQMPRVAPGDDMSGREDRPKPKAPVAKPASPESMDKATMGNGPMANGTPKDYVKTITDDQQGELAALLRETGANVRKLLDHYQVPVLAKLPAIHFEHARSQLLRRRERVNGGQCA